MGSGIWSLEGETGPSIAVDSSATVWQKKGCYRLADFPHQRYASPTNTISLEAVEAMVQISDTQFR